MTTQQSFFNLFVSHKFLENLFLMNLTFMAKMDFFDSKQLSEMILKLQKSYDYLQGHANWEDECIRPLQIKAHIEENSFQDHQQFEQDLLDLIEQFKQFELDSFAKNPHELYLNYRAFCASLSNHLTEEEREIFPRLQHHYTQAELEEIDNPIYRHFSAEDMVNMLKELLPCFNIYEQKMLLTQLKNCNECEFFKVDKLCPELNLKATMKF